MMRMIAAAVAVVLAGPALADDAEDLRQRLTALETDLAEARAGHAKALVDLMAAAEALTRREEELEVLRAEQGNEAELRVQLAAALASRMHAEKAAETALSEAEALRAQIKVLAYETGRFQMQVAGDGGEGIEAWVLDTKTGAVRVCLGTGARTKCSGWVGGHPDTEGMTDEEFLKHLGLE